MFLASLATFLLASHHVGHDEEVSKQDQKRQDVVTIGHGDVAWVLVTVVVHHVNGLGIHAHKLNHLSHGQGRLPPDFLGVERHKVVSVHDGMDKAVQEDSQENVSIIADVDVQPVKLSSENTRIRVKIRVKI